MKPVLLDYGVEVYVKLKKDSKDFKRKSYKKHELGGTFLMHRTGSDCYQHVKPKNGWYGNYDLSMIEEIFPKEENPEYFL